MNYGEAEWQAQYVARAQLKLRVVNEKLYMIMRVLQNIGSSITMRDE
jgi:hypothetical protein